MDRVGDRSMRMPFRRVWQRMGPYIGNDGRRVGILCVTSVMNGFAEAALLYMLIRSATAIASGHHSLVVSLGPIHNRLTSVNALFEGSGVVLLLLFTLSTTGAWLIAKMVSATMARARKATLAAFVGAPWGVQSQEPDGRLQEALTAHTNYVGMGMVQVTNGVVAGFNFLALITSAVLIDAAAAGIVFVGVALIAAAMLPITRLTRRVSRKNLQATSEFSGQVVETVGLAREIKTFDVADAVLTKAYGLVGQSERWAFRVRFLQRATPSIYQYLALTFVLVGLVVVDNVSTSAGVASLGAILLLLVRGLAYAQQVSSAIQQANETAPYIESVDSLRVRYTQAAAAQPHGPAPLPSVDTIRFTDVTFGYDPGRPVLQDMSFETRQGEVVGIVGPSGSGKSTLVQLLLRLRLTDTGVYSVNDVSASSYDATDWYRHFVLVPQENKLLRGSILDNIRFWRSGLTDDALIDAAKRAHLHEDVSTWPEGYQTVVGSGRQEISGGQRQRLGLARALAGKPSVLVLDEPTSALDMQSEHLIQQTLHQIKGELTLFIVAHRISTLNLCDRIMVLENGKIAAMGSHDDVASRNAFFSEAQRLARLPA